MNRVIARPLRSLQRNILAGIITIGPLFVTWLVFSWVLGSLAKAGLPLVQLLEAIFPQHWMAQPVMQSAMAVVLTLVVLFVLGRVTSLVIGRQAFGLFESILERLPFVAKVYTSVRQLLDSMMAKKDTNQRVVLVDFPIAGQKSIGFLTRTMVDSNTRRRTGSSSAAECDQSDIGVSATAAAEPGDQHGPDDGAGNEHADDGRRGGAGEPCSSRSRRHCGTSRCGAYSAALVAGLSTAISSATSLSWATLRRLTCSNCAQMRPTGIVAKECDEEHGGCAGGSCLGRRTDEACDCCGDNSNLREPTETGSWKMLAPPLSDHKQHALGGVSEASSGLAVKARQVVR